MGIDYIMCGCCDRSYPDCASEHYCLKCGTGYCSQRCKNEAFYEIIFSRLKSELESHELDLNYFIESNKKLQALIRMKKKKRNELDDDEILIKKFYSVFDYFFENIHYSELYPCIRCVKDLKYRKFNDKEILEFALKKYKTTREELITQMKTQ